MCGSHLSFSKGWMHSIVSEICEHDFVFVLIPFNMERMELVEFFRRRGYLISNGRSLPYAHGRSLPYAHGVDYGMVDSDDEDAECGFDFSNWSVEKNRNTVISLSDWCDDNGNMEVVDVNLDGNYGVINIDMDRFFMKFDKHLVVFINDYDVELAKCKAYVIDCNKFYN